MTIRPDNFVLFPGYIFHDILDAAGIAPGPDVVGRVRDLARSHEASDMGAADTLRRLDASERDRVGLLATADALRGERDSAREDRNVRALAIQKSHAALTKAGVRQGDVVDRVSALLAERDDARAKVRALDEERADLRKTIAKCQTACDSVGIAIRSDVSERVYHMAAELSSLRQECDALRAPKVAAVEWDSEYLMIGGVRTFWTYAVVSPRARYGVGRVEGNKCGAGYTTDEPSARNLAELLANHDPGGVWRVNGDVVSPDTVRLVCPSVAVTWGES